MRFEIPAQKKLVHEMVIPMRWGDMDVMGNVNNTVYFRYFEIIRLDWLLRARPAGEPAHCGPVIVNAFCSFLRQLEYPGDVLARQYVAAPGRTSVQTYVTLQRADAPQTLSAEGGAKLVWRDHQAQKAMPLPDWLRALVN